MPDILVLNQQEVANLLDLDELREALAGSLMQLSRGSASVPPRSAALTEDGLLGAMPGYVEGAGLGTKLVTVFPRNHVLGQPSHQALILMFDPANGTPLALIDGTYITAQRTAAASAVAARAVARPDSRVLAILGSGVQARSHIDALNRVFDFEEIRIASRTDDHAVLLARRTPRARACKTFRAAVDGADMICCCTDATSPVVDDRWFARGAHVGSVGSGAELDPALIKRSRVFVEWRGSATTPPPAGAAELQGADPDTIVEIGEVLLELQPGRTSNQEITVYKSTGHAVEDLAAAALVLRKANQANVGRKLTL